MQLSATQEAGKEMKQINQTCLQCMECCKWLGFVITTKDMEKSLQMYKWRGCEIKEVKGNQIFMIVPSVCKHLTQFGCGIYHTRPNWCREYDGTVDPAMKGKCLLLKEKESPNDD